MRILGVDPGLAILGWSIVEASTGEVSLVELGTIQTEAGNSMTKRLTLIFSGLNDLIDCFHPSVLALETLFILKSAKTLAQVGHSRGVILLSAGLKNLEVCEYAPRQIKMALTGYGGAEKMQVQQMVKKLLNLRDIPRPDDAADAVAVALCHAQFSRSFPKSAVMV